MRGDTWSHMELASKVKNPHRSGSQGQRTGQLGLLQSVLPGFWDDFTRISPQFYHSGPLPMTQVVDAEWVSEQCQLRSQSWIPLTLESVRLIFYIAMEAMAHKDRWFIGDYWWFIDVFWTFTKLKYCDFPARYARSQECTSWREITFRFEEGISLPAPYRWLLFRWFREVPWWFIVLAWIWCIHTVW